jgi:GT2 family glycosyltransferase
VRGVTYGTFRPDGEGNQYGSPETVEGDFGAMAAAGLNAVRTYSIPPRWLLDTALRHGLRVMVGLPWEQHVAFLDRGKVIEERVRQGVRACAGHPAVLCYAVGNEIPGSVVRWYGRRPVERFVHRLYAAAKDEDPEALITYVNFPTTEYLELPFLDLVCFNVYLESPGALESYLGRLQNIAEDRPLLLGELGLDSHRHGADAQAESLDSQIRTAFAAGCAGAFVFSWTDRWHRGGQDVVDWDFGLVDRERRPKRALQSVRRAFAEVPFPPDEAWPRISVVVCTYNRAAYFRECLEGLSRIDYPNREVIVVNDGSADGTAAIAAQFDVRLINTENGGLASARNLGLQAATGEIVAYIDDDAYPDSHWLTYLAATFRRTSHAGVGGPNLPVPEDGSVADCVAHAPGGPIHVLLTDQVAEHLPGCNMAFRREALEAIGGFDPQFGVAGDDVDLCWRLQERGWTLGFSPAAMVWHHRRDSVRGYWRQQLGYGKAEAVLEAKWPEKYNMAGHPTWAGRLYGKGAHYLGRARRVYHGMWGSAPFQSLDRRGPGVLASLPAMPEWYLVMLGLAGLAALGLLWRPLLLALPLFALAVAALVAHGIRAALRAPLRLQPATERSRRRALIAFLYLLQPLARLCGRLPHGLTPWRQRPALGMAYPGPRVQALWREQWRDAEEWLRAISSRLRQRGLVVLSGGDYDRWDLEVRQGALGGVRLRLAIEDHGGGRQMVRLRSWPWAAPKWVVAASLLGGLALAAVLEAAVGAGLVLGGSGLLVGVAVVRQCGAAAAAVLAFVSEAEDAQSGRLPAREA